MALTLALVAAGAAGSAHAASTDIRIFDIAAQPLPTALVDFAVQSGVSIGGVRACQGTAPPLRGRYTLSEALARLLAGSGCSYRWIDGETARIAPVTKPPAPRRPPTLAARPQAKEPEPEFASEVVVTATKRPELRDHLPYAISAIGAEQIRIFGAGGASDIGLQAAGVTVTNLGPGRNKILLRGLSDGAFTGHTQSTVGIYLDNVPITYNAPDPDLRLADIETVEVLRGPQGSLYGSGSIGGIYRIVPRKPELDRDRGYVTLSGALTLGGAASGVFEAMVNAPLRRDRIGLRVVGYHEVDGGYIDNVSLGRRNVNRTTRTGFRSALLAALGADWTVELGGAVQFIGSADTQYATASAGRYARANLVREPHDNDFNQVHATLTGRTKLGRLTSSTALVQHDVDSAYDASAARSAFSLPGAGAASLEDRIHIDLLVHETHLASRDDSRLRWLMGWYASASEERTLDLMRESGSPSSLAAYREDRKDHLQELAGFGEASYSLTPRLSLTAGLRYFRTSVRTTSIVQMPRLGAERSFTGQDRYSGWSPKLALQYQLTSNSLVYGLASQGYRAGGFNTEGVIGETFSAAGGGHPARKFTPDALWNFELGVKTALFDRKVQLRASAFYNAWSNLQTDQFLSSGLSYTANIGDGRNNGVEVEAAYKPVDSLTIQVNALLGGPELSRVNPGALAFTDRGMPGVPGALVGSSAIYRRSLGGGADFTLAGQAQYVGRSRLTFDANLAPVMGGHVVTKLVASLENERWRFAGSIANPVNSRGNTFAFGNPFSLPVERQQTPLRPMTVRLDLTAKF